MNSQESRRLDAYVRVSQVRGREGDSFISPQVQEERIRAWAVAHGHEILKTHRELDVSGGTMDRPMLNEVMARIEEGETDGVVVYRLDRFGRTLVGALELIDRIRQREALFASVSDGFDITTETGRLVLNILLSIAQFERERIKENWITAKSNAVSRGIHVSANVPLGYRRGRGPVNPKTGKPSPAPLEPDPDTAWVVPVLFQRRAAGETWESLRRWLVANNVPTVRGAAWSGSTLLTTIRNRVYLGEARGVGDHHVVQNAHPALVDEATWYAAQGRRVRHPQRENPMLLRGLVRCGRCRYVMQARPSKSGRGDIYICNSRVGCPHPANITGRGFNGGVGLDQVVVETVREWEREREERIAFEGFDPALDLAEDEQELAAMVAARERDRLDEKLQAALGRDEWVRHLADLTVRINEKREAIEETLRQVGRPEGRPYAELWEKWESGEMSVDEKRDHLASAIQAVFVNPTTDRGGTKMSPDLRRRRFASRIHVVWANDPPLLDVPRHGQVGYQIRPWPFPDSDPDVVGVVPTQPAVEHAGDAVG